MEVKKKEIPLSIGILLFIGMLFSLVLFLCKSREVESLREEEKSISNMEKISSVDFSKCNTQESGEECQYLLSTNDGNTVLVTTRIEKVHDGGDKTDEANTFDMYQIFFNDIRIAELGRSYILPQSIKVWDNFILVHYNSGTGCGNYSRLIVFNSSLGLVADYGGRYKSDLYPEFATLTLSEINIDDKTKTIEILANNWNGCEAFIMKHEGTASDICEEDGLVERLGGDYIVEASYKIEYNGKEESFRKPSRKVDKDLETALQVCNGT